MPKQRHHWIKKVILNVTLAALLSLNGCAAIAIALLGATVGVAGETAVGYSMSGVASQTLTAPLPRVRRAAMSAMRHMGIRIQGRETTTRGEIIKGKATDRLIEVRLDRVTRRSTRMRAVARHGFFRHDRATATEIIRQTQIVLNGRS